MGKGKGKKGGFRGGGGGGGGMPNMQNLMKQAQQMQAEMERTQAELADKTKEVTVGGGAVTVVVNGKHELVSIKILPDALDPEDAETLEEMIVAAVNQANGQITEESEEAMGSITGGMKLPGM